MTFGADYRRQQINRASDPNARGQYTFTGASTADLVNGVASAGTGFDFASFLLGRPDTSALRYGNSNLYFRTAAYDVYMTDDWRITQKFSINFGIRWDYQTSHHRAVQPPGESRYRARLRRHRPGSARSVRTLLGRRCLPPWSIRTRTTSRPASVLRGGLCPRRTWSSAAATAPTTTLPSTTTSPTTWRSSRPSRSTLNVATTGLPLGVPMTQYFSFISGQNQLTNTYAIDPNYRIGYAQMWQISVQQDLGHSLVGTITYNGTKGTGLDQTLLPNSAPSGASAQRTALRLHLRTVQRQLHLPRRLLPAHAPLPQRLLRQRHLHLLQSHRQRRTGAELPRYLGRSRPLQQQPAQRAEPQLAVQHRGRSRRRHADQWLEGHPAERLDPHQHHQRGQRTAADSGHRRRALHHHRHRHHRQPARQCHRTAGRRWRGRTAVQLPGLRASRSRTMGQRRPQYHHRTHPVQPQRGRSAAPSASASASSIDLRFDAVKRAQPRDVPQLQHHHRQQQPGPAFRSQQPCAA